MEQWFDWIYYYTAMTFSFAILLTVIFVIGYNMMCARNVKTQLRILQVEQQCCAYRELKIRDLAYRAQHASTIQERDRVFDEMKAYRTNYLINRKSPT